MTELDLRRFFGSSFRSFPAEVLVGTKARRLQSIVIFKGKKNRQQLSFVRLRKYV